MTKIYQGEGYPELCSECRAAINACATAVQIGPDIDDEEGALNLAGDLRLLCGGTFCQASKEKGGREMECPYIEREITPDPNFNKPISYATADGNDYVFYDHHDEDWGTSRVQFCQLAGRKRDVFQCLNESEWQTCQHFPLQVAVQEA